MGCAGGPLYMLPLASKKLPKGSIQMAAKAVYARLDYGLEEKRRFFLQNATRRLPDHPEESRTFQK